MKDIAWLTSRPVAHRAYHNAAAGRIENSLSAVEAAIAHGFSIEVDLERSSDGVPMVFHDDTLDRLTDHSGPVRAKTAAELARIKLAGSDDRIPTLQNLLDLVGGRAGLVIEIKSDFSGDTSIIETVVDILSRYHGRFAVMSFDPDFIAQLRRIAPHITRGIVACRASPRNPVWRRFTLMERFILRHMLHAPRSCPDFISYDIDSLPALGPLAMKAIFKRPLLTWTIRTPAQGRRAKRWSDQITFEGFDPSNA